MNGGGGGGGGDGDGDGAAAEQQQRPLPDLRLVGPALVVWATTAVVLKTAPAGALWLVGGVLVTACGAVLLRWPGHGPRGRQAAALLLSVGAAGLASTLATADLHRGPLPGLARRQAAVAVRLTVTRDPREGAGGGAAPYVVVRATVDRVEGMSVRTPVTVLAEGPDSGRWSALLPSTRLVVSGRLRAVDGGDVAALLVVRGPPEVVAGPDAVQRAAGSLRTGLRSAVRPLDPDPRALLPGLVVGDTSALPAELQEAFQATDLAHITAVSGANLSIVLVLLVGAAARARTAERGGLAARAGLPLRFTAGCGAALTVGFVILCRPDPSVLRAAATGLIMLLALATGRRAAPLAALAGATLLLMLVDPWLALSYGFALSAMATAGLLTLGPRWAEALTRRGWPPRLAEAVACAASAQALCGPLLVVKAARVSLVAVPCNLLAEAAVAPATLLGFAALAVAPVWMAAAEFLAWLASFPADWIVSLARFAAALPGAELAWPGGWGGAALLVAVTCAAAACLPVLRNRLVAALLALSLLAVLLRPAPLTRLVTGWPPDHWRVVMCSVGQGDAVVVSAGPGTALVIDTGPDPRPVDQCLRDLGVVRVPLLLLTHDHADHVEGLPGVLHDRQVGAIEATPSQDPPGEWARVRRWAGQARVPLLTAAVGERRSLGELHWQVLWPDGPTDSAVRGPNNASVALLVTAPGLRMAFLGDLEPPAQSRLLDHLDAYPGLRHVDVLKVAHHGSAKQDADLLRALSPRVALISCGVGNSYGHPAPATLSLLHTLGATVLRTDLQGDLAVLDTGGHMSVTTHER
ncbi:ComEC/Rec2 family competence protein [Streptacidiphilus carbonis]|uniref:ComEC/Rec2 family competence protein n=1 Tax=Streptacidiphilus carbonis TaxID=105422 RepID=UPI0005A9ACE9|nr:ComEC/Rec2 family competence protein [Streptacidiphilus carbonis]